MLFVEHAQFGPGVRVPGLQFDHALEFPQQAFPVPLLLPDSDQKGLNLGIVRGQGACFFQVIQRPAGIPACQFKNAQISQRGDGVRIQLQGLPELLFGRPLLACGEALGSLVDQGRDHPLPGIPGQRVQLSGPAEGSVGLFETPLLEAQLPQTEMNNA